VGRKKNGGKLAKGEKDWVEGQAQGRKGKKARAAGRLCPKIRKKTREAS